MSATIHDEVPKKGSMWVCRETFELEFKNNEKSLERRQCSKNTCARVKRGDENTIVFVLNNDPLMSKTWWKLTRAEFLQYFQTSTDFLEEMKKANVLKPWQAHWLEDIQMSKEGSSEDSYLTPEVVERVERWLAECSEACKPASAALRPKPPAFKTQRPKNNSSTPFCERSPEDLSRYRPSTVFERIQKEQSASSKSSASEKKNFPAFPTPHKGSG